MQKILVQAMLASDQGAPESLVGIIMPGMTGGSSFVFPPHRSQEVDNHLKFRWFIFS